MINLEQNTVEWLEFRKNKIGASDIPIILGISPYCTPYELWRRKLGFSKQDETSAMAWGKTLEPVVRDEINKEKKYNFIPSVIVSKDLEWAIASLDGIDEEQKILLEIKCTSKIHHDMIKTYKCPDSFYAQIQWQLFVSDYQQCLLVHYFSEEKVEMIILRDEEYIVSSLLDRVTDFYLSLIKMDPPEMSEKDFAQIVDEDFKEVASQWIDLKNQKKELEEKEKILRQKILNFTDDGNCEGYGLEIRKKKRQGSVAWEQLWKDACEKFSLSEVFDPEKYRKPDTIFWEIKEKNVG